MNVSRVCKHTVSTGVAYVTRYAPLPECGFCREERIERQLARVREIIEEYKGTRQPFVTSLLDKLTRALEEG